MGFFSRLFAAVNAFFSVLGGRELSPGSLPLQKAESTERAGTPAAAASAPSVVDDKRRAVQLLGALQREGRLVDFLMDEIDGASDSDIGAAARVVHRGCKKVLDASFELVPLWPGQEGSIVEIEPGYDLGKVDILGGAAEAPFQATLNHAGWGIRAIRLPNLTDGFSTEVLQKAEIER